MKIEDYTKKIQVQKRLSMIKSSYKFHEGMAYRRLMHDFKKGDFPLKPTSIKDSVINSMDCDPEVEMLKAWLLGFKACSQMSQEKSQ